VTVTVIILIAVAAAIILAALFIADALDERAARQQEAERYARLVRAKHDTANDLLNQAGRCMEMSSMVAAQFRHARPHRPSGSDATVIDGEYTVQRNG
jgi:hypothetical protein